MFKKIYISFVFLQLLDKVLQHIYFLCGIKSTDCVYEQLRLIYQIYIFLCCKNSVINLRRFLWSNSCYAK